MSLSGFPDQYRVAGSVNDLTDFDIGPPSLIGVCSREQTFL